jgi:hypothetical protein
MVRIFPEAIKAWLESESAKRVIPGERKHHPRKAKTTKRQKRSTVSEAKNG